ncbi:DUF6962 family protein [Microbulbifer sp. TRSA002]|uniref:DUF6962 family protein n=1 Tax=Microbulbifer sp. TRSA002 TaxID=3243382 RepID=UPI00403A772D
MKIVHDEIELTTAATDLGLAFVAIYGVLYLLIYVNGPSWKRDIWICFFSFMFIVSLMAAAYHGISLSPSARHFLWYGVLVLFGLLISTFVLAVAVDFIGEGFSKRFIPVIFGIYLAVLIGSMFLKDKFLGFAIYQMLISSVALVVYIAISVAEKKYLPGSWLMALGALISIVAMLIQINGTLSFEFIWKFNYNGIYHIVQTVGIACFIIGLHRYFSTR